jgi:hypothetical protein
VSDEAVGEAVDKGRAQTRGVGRLSIVAAFLIVVCLGVIYWLYFRSRTEYLTDRNLRLLGSVAGQVDAKVAQSVTFLGNFARYKSKTGLLNQEAFTQDFRKDRDPDPETVEQFARYFPGFETLLHNCPFRHQPDTSVKEQIRQEPTSHLVEPRITNRSGNWWLDLGYHELEFVGYSDRERTVPTEKIHNAYGQIPLKKLLGETFGSDALKTFDSIFIANVDGRVVYQLEPFDKSSRAATESVQRQSYRRDALDSPSAALRVSSIDSIFEKRGWKDPLPVDLASLAGTTRHLPVTIAGNDYILFLQPCVTMAAIQPELGVTAGKSGEAKETASPPAGTTGQLLKPGRATPKAPGPPALSAPVAKASPTQWVVGALVSQTRFTYEALAISVTLLALLTALLLLVICCWPFVRLSLIGERQPLTLADVMLLGVSTLIGVAILTLGIADTVVYRRAESLCDVHLRRLSTSLEHNFNKDVQAAYDALATLDNGADFNAFSAGSETFTKISTNEMDGVASAVSKFPYFNSISWIDAIGEQGRKLSSGEFPAPPVRVDGRAYFREMQEGRPWFLDGERQKPFMFESIVSQTTGAPEAVLSTYSRRSPHFPLAALTLSRTAFSDASLPAGYTFAVIDDGGNVLFHHDLQRIGHENFFPETDHDRQFRAAVLAHHESLVNIRYSGEDHRAYVHRLSLVPWTLVVMRNKRLLRTMNIEAIVLTLLCLVLYATVAVILVIGVSLAIPAYRAPWIWPEVRAGNRYWRLLTIYFLVAVSCAAQLAALDLMPLLLVGFVAPFQIAATTYVRLARHTRTVSYYVLTVVWVALSVIWLCALAKPNLILDGLATPRWLPWLRALMIVPLCVAVAMVIWKVVDDNRIRAWVQILMMGSIVLEAITLSRTWWPVLAVIAFAEVVALTRFCTAPNEQARAAWERWAALMTVVSIVAIILCKAAPDAPFPLAGKSIAVVLIAAAMLVAFAKDAKRVEKGVAFQPYAYIVAGSLFVVLTVVVPTVAYFRLAISLEIESFIKHGQLVIAQRMQEQIESSVRDSFSNGIAMRSSGDRGDFFNSSWWLTSKGRPLDRVRAPDITEWKPRPRADELPGVLESRLPQYSEESVAMRELHHDTTDDGGWTWKRSGNVLALQRHLNLGLDAVEAFAAKDVPVPDAVVVVTHLPKILWQPADPLPFPLTEASLPLTAIRDPLVVRSLRWTAYAAAVAAFALVVLWIVRFVSRKIFLIDLHAPLWARPRKTKDEITLSPTIGSHLYLVERSSGATIATPGFRPLALKKLYDNGVIDEIVAVDRMCDGMQVLIEGIDANLEDLRFTEFKLAVVEQVVALQGRTVLIVSSMTPEALVSITDRLSSAAGKVALASRWHAVLTGFICVFDDQIRRHAIEEAAQSDGETPAGSTETKPAETKPRGRTSKVSERLQVLRQRIVAIVKAPRAAFAEIPKLVAGSCRRLRSLGAGNATTTAMKERLQAELAEETKGHSFLEKIRDELRDDIAQDRIVDSAQLLDEIAERASAYYATLWATCSREEQLLLAQLARHGLMNGSDRRSVRRLIVRGLVVRNPNLQTMNDSFRIFVCSASGLSDLQKYEEEESSASTWTRIRVPAMIILLGIIIFFFSTQKDLLNTTSALVTGLAAGLPALAKLVGMVGARRTSAQASQ